MFALKETICLFVFHHFFCLNVNTAYVYLNLMLLPVVVEISLSLETGLKNLNLISGLITFLLSLNTGAFSAVYNRNTPSISNVTGPGPDMMPSVSRPGQPSAY